MSMLMLAAVIAAAAVLSLALPAAAAAPVAQLSATPASLDGVFASARAGDTIELASGDYGTFRGAMKSGVVTLTPQENASVTMELDFDPASNITIDGVRITYAELADGATHDIVVRNSDIPGQVIFRTNELANANVFFEHNVHRDFDVCGTCGEGRVWLPGERSARSGITIRNSEFRGGLSDGIQNGSNGTRILNNTFHDIEPGNSGGVHADAIQLYGSRNTIIRGNYFYNLIDVPAIMSPDGSNHELIEDNVVEGTSDSYPFALTLFSDDSSIIRHNTFADGHCVFDLRCGILRIGAKSGDPAGRRTVVEDNIVSDISVETGNLARRTHNLIAHGRPSGTTEIAGSPTYVGGSSPTRYAGYRLAPGSKGKGNASDGLDRGARIGVGACEAATAKVRRAKKKLKRAKKKLHRADGREQRKKVKRKVKRAKKKLKRAKKKRQQVC